MFFRRNSQKSAATLGRDSLLILMKLGYDLRSEYDQVLEEPLPKFFSAPLARLDRLGRSPSSH
jgi:hypothetical protein